MKRLIAAIALIAPLYAHAASWFQFEAGSGAAYGQTLNDGVWYQQGAAQSSLHALSPAYLVGATGELARSDAVDLRYHIDYVYFGSQRASCQCVSDDDYNPHAHQVVKPNAATSAFAGSGHVQGIAATLDAGYNYGAWRFGAEAGPWVFWETWHEQAAPTGDWIDVSHKTVPQLSWVAGANITHGALTLSYRYYNLPQRWNPYPALLRAAHVVTFVYRY